MYYLVFKVTPLINSVPYFKTPTRLDSIRTKRTVSFKAGLPSVKKLGIRDKLGNRADGMPVPFGGTY